MACAREETKPQRTTPPRQAARRRGRGRKCLGRYPPGSLPALCHTERLSLALHSRSSSAPSVKLPCAIHCSPVTNYRAEEAPQIRLLPPTPRKKQPGRTLLRGGLKEELSDEPQAAGWQQAPSMSKGKMDCCCVCLQARLMSPGFH